MTCACEALTIKMPSLPCPLGARCYDGEDGSTWKTVDLPFEQAMILLECHVKYAHQNGGAGTDADHVNVNSVGSGGTQGGNFVNSQLHHSIFNLQTPGEAERQRPPSDASFILVCSDGPSAYQHGSMLGWYYWSEDTEEGRSVYVQEHDPNYWEADTIEYKLFSNKGAWVIMSENEFLLRASSASPSPASANRDSFFGFPVSKWIQWQYLRYRTWHDDPKLSVTSFSDYPDKLSFECEVTITLSEDIVKDDSYHEEWNRRSVSGVYRPDGSYHQGRQVLRHTRGKFVLYVNASGCWTVTSEIGGIHCGGFQYLRSWAAPTHCPGDPRTARNENGELSHWEYWEPDGRARGWTESSGISVKCNKRSCERLISYIDMTVEKKGQHRVPVTYFESD